MQTYSRSTRPSELVITDLPPLPLLVFDGEKSEAELGITRLFDDCAWFKRDVFLGPAKPNKPYFIGR